MNKYEQSNCSVEKQTYQAVVALNLHKIAVWYFKAAKQKIIIHIILHRASARTRHFFAIIKPFLQMSPHSFAGISLNILHRDSPFLEILDGGVLGTCLEHFLTEGGDGEHGYHAGDENSGYDWEGAHFVFYEEEGHYCHQGTHDRGAKHPQEAGEDEEYGVKQVLALFLSLSEKVEPEREGHYRYVVDGFRSAIPKQTGYKQGDEGDEREDDTDNADDAGEQGRFEEYLGVAHGGGSEQAEQQWIGVFEYHADAVADGGAVEAPYDKPQEVDDIEFERQAPNGGIGGGLQPYEAEELKHSEAHGHQVDSDAGREGEQPSGECQAPKELHAGVAILNFLREGTFNYGAVGFEEFIAVPGYYGEIYEIEKLHYITEYKLFIWAA